MGSRVVVSVTRVEVTKTLIIVYKGAKLKSRTQSYVTPLPLLPNLSVSTFHQLLNELNFYDYFYVKSGP